jgi:hypothetical protein
MVAQVVELDHVELPASALTRGRGGEIAQRRAQLSATSARPWTRATSSRDVAVVWLLSV